MPDKYERKNTRATAPIRTPALKASFMKPHEEEINTAPTIVIRRTPTAKDILILLNLTFSLGLGAGLGAGAGVGLATGAGCCTAATGLCTAGAG